MGKGYLVFILSQPQTWTPREARNEAGTLLCICGAPGKEFFVDGTEIKDGQQYGVLRGACCDAHWEAYRRHTRPEEYKPTPEDILLEEEKAPALVPVQVADYGPLFAGLEGQ
jgi:hypothetical protein